MSASLKIEPLDLFEDSSEKLENGYYKNKTFKGVQLTNETMKEKEFYNCTFVNCTLMKCTLFSCSFEKCAFENCNVSSLLVKHSSFLNVNFETSKMMGINWTQAAIPLDVNFSQSILDYSIFLGLNLNKIKIIDCQVKEVDFAEAILTKAILSGSDFENSRFLNTNLTKTNFENATNYSINPNQNILNKTIFSLPEAVSLLNDFNIVLK